MDDCAGGDQNLPQMVQKHDQKIIILKTAGKIPQPDQHVRQEEKYCSNGGQNDGFKLLIPASPKVI